MQSVLIQLNGDDFREMISESVATALGGLVHPPTNNPPEDELLTQAETAAFLRTTKQTVIAWTKQGRLKVKRFGRKVLYSKNEVLRVGEVSR